MEREVAGGDPALEHGQHRPPVRARERAGLRDGGVVALDRVRERAQQLGGDERHVRRQDDHDLRSGEPEGRGDTDHGGTDVAAVVEDLEGEIEPVGGLADHDHLAERLGEHAVPALGERLALVACERLRGAEARARAADEQGAGYARPVAYHARAVRLKGPSGASSRSR